MNNHAWKKLRQIVPVMKSINLFAAVMASPTPMTAWLSAQELMITPMVPANKCGNNARIDVF
jgi:hypothetical protein